MRNGGCGGDRTFQQKQTEAFNPRIINLAETNDPYPEKSIYCAVIRADSFFEFVDVLSNIVNPNSKIERKTLLFEMKYYIIADKEFL